MSSRALSRMLVLLSSLVVLWGAAATAGAATGPRLGASSRNAVTRTFSFIERANSRTTTVLNIDSLLINARCDSRGNPVVFAFSGSDNAVLFGRLFDGLGRGHIIRQSAFTRASRGVLLSITSYGDFDSSGTVNYENSAGQVVTVEYSFDNATTLNHLPVCTVYGSAVAS